MQVRSSTIPPVSAVEDPIARPPERRLARVVAAAVVLTLLGVMGFASPTSSAPSARGAARRAEASAATARTKVRVPTFDRIGGASGAVLDSAPLDQMPDASMLEDAASRPLAPPPRARHAVLRPGGVLNDPGF